MADPRLNHAVRNAALDQSIIKAVSPLETSPKRKHVRSVIVYTWDHKNATAFWAALKVQPIIQSGVQTWKALILVHKVMQEGHKSALREAANQTQWFDGIIRTLSTEPTYGRLIATYAHYLLEKIRFHRNHPEFNGLFEYEEYISLKAVDDPNEGFETITELCGLLDQIHSLQKLIFAHFQPSSNNECRIAGLIPLVQESYGIYKFILSMLRALAALIGGAEDVLEPLVNRFNQQHRLLVSFYYECSNLRYLTSLISVPRLPQSPPNVFEDEAQPPALPERPREQVTGTSSPAPVISRQADPEPISDFWSNEQAQERREFEETQLQLQQQREAEMQRQQMLALQQQRDFENQQHMQAEQQRLAQEQLLRDQYARQAQGRLAELEREILNMRGQYDKDQLLLEQYDRRVKALENELQQMNSNFAQQNDAKDEMLRSLQDQVTIWKNKYEQLAKLYSQLRQEHLDLLTKFKSMQLKANSAQEAIDRKERIEREMKSKNLELADMIRERDRARYELDRLKGSNKGELEKLQRELRFAKEKAEDLERTKASELSSMLAKYNREMADLEEALHAKTRALDDTSRRVRDRDSELEDALRQKEEELEIYKTGMDTTLLQLKELQLVPPEISRSNRQTHTDSNQALDSQIDDFIKDHIKKLNDIIDSVLQSAIERVEDALHELDSPMQAGNQNSTAGYLLSVIEKASSTATEFAISFNNFILDGPNGDHAEVIKTANIFAGAVADILINAKGITRLASTPEKADNLVNAARDSANRAKRFFFSLQSSRLEKTPVDQRPDAVIQSNMEVQEAFQRLTKLTDAFAPKNKLDLANGDIGELVDREMRNAAQAIAQATAKLTELRSRPKDPNFSSIDLQVHDAILAAAIAITNAIAELIQAATDTQQEIVAQGRGSNTKAAFYKRNNRWTEGLISAAKAVAVATNILIDTADGVIGGRNSPEQLIVASNEVAAATAQLVAASRVKASFMSKTQERLEGASRAVTNAVRVLVRQVEDIVAKRLRGEEEIDYSRLSSREFKVEQMQTQVEILKLEQALQESRRRLGIMRKMAYQEE